VDEEEGGIYARADEIEMIRKDKGKRGRRDAQRGRQIERRSVKVREEKKRGQGEHRALGGEGGGGGRGGEECREQAKGMNKRGEGANGASQGKRRRRNGERKRGERVSESARTVNRKSR